MSKQLHKDIPSELLNPSAEFQNVMEGMDIYWWYWNILEKKLLLSPKLIGVLGYNENDFDPTVPTFDKNIHPEDRTENLRQFNLFLEEKIDVYEKEYRLNVDGKWSWFYNRGTIIKRDKHGKPVLVGGIAMNISHKYNRMLSRIEEASKFEFIFRNTNEPVIISTMGDDVSPGKIVEVNQAAARLFGTEPVEMIGLNPYEIMDSSYIEKRQDHRDRLLGEGSLKMDVKAKDFNGRIKYLEVNTHAFTLTGEDLFVAVISDKTESYNYKNELKASKYALKKSEEILTSLIKAANDRIGIFDTDGNIVIINDAFTEALGYSLDEFRNLEIKERIHPDDKLRIEKSRDELFSTGHLSNEYRAQHKDGHYIHMYSKSVLLRDPDYDKDYVLFIIRDVTVRVGFQKELIEAKEKAEESDKLKSAFLANMSHEIRTPLNSIVGFANLLSDEAADRKTREEYMRRINRNSEQLLTLISDIIDLAKIESNQLSVCNSKVIIENLFNDLINYGKLQLEAGKNESVTLTYEPDPLFSNLIIESDLVRLMQIMQNLVNNAVKFTMEGEIKIGYTVQDNKTVRCFVKDTGIGIDSKDFMIIFDQFRQIDSSDVRKFRGTGLGLAICRNLATLLSGKIWVDSVPGEGSAFYVELPIFSGLLLDSDENVKSEKSTDTGQVTMLMVDDDPDSLMLMSTMMQNESVQVITTDSGYKALEILDREALPDVVLMDLEMPVMNGAQTLTIIREKYPELKVVAQSAHALEGDREKTIVSGFDDYISKPFNKQSILEVIKSSNRTQVDINTC